MGGTAPDSFSGDMGGIWFEPVNSGCCDSWLRTKPGSNLAKVPGQCGLEQQELAHAIHRDHSNQPTGPPAKNDNHSFAFERRPVQPALRELLGRWSRPRELPWRDPFSSPEARAIPSHRPWEMLEGG